MYGYFVLAWVSLGITALNQEVTVSGRLMCSDNTMPGAIVTLIEEESLISIEEKAVVRSDSNGQFLITAVYNSTYKILPVLKIEHECGGDRKVTERLVLFDFWTTEKSTVKQRIFDFGPFPLMQHVYHWECNAGHECKGDAVQI